MKHKSTEVQSSVETFVTVQKKIKKARDTDKTRGYVLAKLATSDDSTGINSLE